MAVTVARLEAKLAADTKAFDRAMAKSKAEMSGVEGVSHSMANAIRNMPTNTPPSLRSSRGDHIQRTLVGKKNERRTFLECGEGADLYSLLGWRNGSREREFSFRT